MDPTRQFFSNLRKLAVTLETETAKLQQAFESRNNEDERDSSENTARAMRSFHALNSDMGNLKVQIRDQLTREKEKNNEVSSFIRACQVLEKRVAQDIQAVRAHWEKYGYQAPSDHTTPTKAEREEEEEKSTEEEQSQEEDGGSASTPLQLQSSLTDVMRTPQLSDFGLSEIQLKRTLAGMEWCPEAPPMPQMSLPQPSLDTPAPPMPITPKCALRMDDDELQTPQMHDFGISEHTMCLNNDFTMNLLRKNAGKPQRELSEPKVTSIMESLQAKAEKLESPELPELCSIGLKMRKTNGHQSSQEQASAGPESPHHTAMLPSTPELPAFQTPYLNRLVSTKKSSQQPEAVSTRADNGDGGHAFDLPTPVNGATSSKRAWEYNLPDSSLLGMESHELPEMPNLESVLGRSLTTKNPKLLKMSEHEDMLKDPTVHSLDLDGPTQEFSLGTPRVRTNYEEPSTPEMPDLSSVTQDICKLVSQAQFKKATTAIVQPHIRAENNKHSAFSRAVSLPEVSGSEFQTLPSYLRQMSLSNLNQAVRSINQFTTDHRGEVTELHMEELNRIIGVGAKAPVYILCLTELKRLNHVGELKNTSVLKLITRS